MGSAKVAARSRTLLQEHLQAEMAQRVATNALRNPFKDYEKYVLPLMVGLASWLCSVVLGATCSSSSKACKSAERNFSSIYMMVMLFLVYAFWGKILTVGQYLKGFAPPELMAVLQAGSSSAAAVGGGAVGGSAGGGSAVGPGKAKGKAKAVKSM